jgi:hypothetical protein
MTEVRPIEQDFEAEVARHAERLEADRAGVEPVQDWYFTFGHGQYHRVTGEHLLGAYVVINGTYAEARERMVDAFGTAWCDQYVDAERAGVAEYSLRRIELPEPSPVTPAEERTGISDVRHAVLDEVAEMHRILTAAADGRPWDVEEARAHLDRIELWTRGEKQ